MGSGWSIKSFDRLRWDEIFGGGMPEAEQKILDAMLWEESGYFDAESNELLPGSDREQILASREGRQAKALACHLARAGFSYSGLDAAQARLLDEFGAVLGSQEALADELDVKYYSPNFVSRTMISELLYCTGNARVWPSRWSFRLMRQLSRSPARHLPLLLTGRRFGTEAQPTQSPDSFYVIFSPTEVAELRDEVRAAINAPVCWQHPAQQPRLAEDYLVAPLNEVLRSGRWASMTLNL